ncbi:HEPN domain-containing protein [Thermococcus sp.]|uniref:HEPN domain-containing protein n=1 Tax=Thermococcus sp. TaxID=35749 RepID=UPI00260338C7|nr:HEPN domain-containing protein [Thermococcus sp.]
MFGLHFVDEGFLERVYAKYLASAFTLRSKADYDVYYKPSGEEAEAVVENVERFLERITTALEEPGYRKESSGS